MGTFSRMSLGRSIWLIWTILGFASITNASLPPTPELSGSLKSISRNPRLFYVSPTTSTTSDTTWCYIASATGACKRKRRDLVADDSGGQFVKKRRIESGPIVKEEEDTERDAKMLLYWVTTTFTTTSYTATSTLATLACLPGGWEMPACG